MTEAEELEITRKQLQAMAQRNVTLMARNEADSVTITNLARRLVSAVERAERLQKELDRALGAGTANEGSGA